MGLFQVIRTGREVDTLRLRVGYAPAFEPRLATRCADDVRGAVLDGARRRARSRARARTTRCSKLGPPHKIPRVAAMTRRSTETLWGVGTLRRRHGRASRGRSRTPRSSATSARRRARARRRSASTAGTRVLFCSMLSEAGQFWPFIGRRHARRARSSRAPTRTRATRCASRCSCGSCEYRRGARRDRRDPRRARRARSTRTPTCSARSTIVGARPDAYARLAAAGLAPHHFVAVRPGRRDRVADRARRRASTPTSGSSTSTRRPRARHQACSPRATTFVRTPTAVRGALVDGGIVAATRTEERHRR